MSGRAAPLAPATRDALDQLYSEEMQIRITDRGGGVQRFMDLLAVPGVVENIDRDPHRQPILTFSVVWYYEDIFDAILAVRPPFLRVTQSADSEGIYPGMRAPTSVLVNDIVVTNQQSLARLIALLQWTTETDLRVPYASASGAWECVGQRIVALILARRSVAALTAFLARGEEVRRAIPGARGWTLADFWPAPPIGDRMEAPAGGGAEAAAAEPVNNRLILLRLNAVDNANDLQFVGLLLENNVILQPREDERERLATALELQERFLARQNALLLHLVSNRRHDASGLPYFPPELYDLLHTGFGIGVKATDACASNAQQRPQKKRLLSYLL